MENPGGFMKAKKAVKRLTKIEDVLAGIIDDYSSDKPVVRELLDAARGSIAQAKAKLTPPVPRATAKKTTAKNGAAHKATGDKAAAGKTGLSAAGRKKLSAAAKKRWAVAKRKGVHAVTGRPLQQTA
jgi:hypothetical protein